LSESAQIRKAIVAAIGGQGAERGLAHAGLPFGLALLDVGQAQIERRREQGEPGVQDQRGVQFDPADVDRRGLDAGRDRGEEQSDRLGRQVAGQRLEDVLLHRGRATHEGGDVGRPDRLPGGEATEAHG
jgi:hypothetical protein